MNIFFLIITFILPIVLILIGRLYLINSSKHINNIWSLIISSAMSFSGILTGYEISNDIGSKSIASNKMYGKVWIYSGILLLIINTLLLKKSASSNIGGLLLELQCLIIGTIYVILEFFLKKKSFN